MPDALHPITLTARDKPELEEIFRRQDAKEFRIATMEYGHGRPGKPFVTLGVIWPTEQQENLL